MLNRLKTLARITGDVLAGRSMPETILPKMRNHVVCEIISEDGTRRMVDGYNTRVNSGASWQAYTMGSSSTAPANFIALSGTSITVGSTDTTLSNEITAVIGLSRAQGTFQSYNAPTATGASANYQITKTFTAGAGQTVSSAAMFNALSGGALFVEANLSPAATLASGDQLVLTWTVNI
jgi:hypothetical protein